MLYNMCSKKWDSINQNYVLQEPLTTIVYWCLAGIYILGPLLLIVSINYLPKIIPKNTLILR